MKTFQQKAESTGFSDLVNYESESHHVDSRPQLTADVKRALKPGAPKIDQSGFMNAHKKKASDMVELDSVKSFIDDSKEEPMQIAQMYIPEQ